MPPAAMVATLPSIGPAVEDELPEVASQGLKRGQTLLLILQRGSSLLVLGD